MDKALKIALFRGIKWHGRQVKSDGAYKCSDTITPSAKDQQCYAFHYKEQGNFDNETDIFTVKYVYCIWRHLHLLKGTLQRDFQPLTLFIKQLYLGP
jgi:hypothetical protein